MKIWRGGVPLHYAMADPPQMVTLLVCELKVDPNHYPDLFGEGDSSLCGEGVVPIGVESGLGGGPHPSCVEGFIGSGWGRIL